MRLISILAIALMASFCAQSPRNQVKIGMDQDQVRTLWGEPASASNQNALTILQYDHPEGETHLLTFYADRLQSIDVLSNEAFVKKQVSADSLSQKAAAPLRGQVCNEGNFFGDHPPGGGCNEHGCWPRGGSCNSFGCSRTSKCTASSCPDRLTGPLCP